MQLVKPLFCAVMAVWVYSAPGCAASESGSRITELKRKEPVDFNKDIYPLLKKNCIACHSASKPKNGLNLESPESIRKGGENGPAVKPGKALESLLLRSAAGLEEPFMPPKKNKVDAQALKPDELGLLKLWIDQGAKGGAGVPAATKSVLQWRPLPEGLNPIFAVAITNDGQYGACGRANQIFIYHLPTNQLVARLHDPALNNTVGADHDFIQSLAFNPAGDLLASAGYRCVKLWKRVPALQFSFAASAQCVTTSSDGKWIAIGGADKSVRICDAGDGKVVRELSGTAGAVTCVKFSFDNSKLCASSEKSIQVWDSNSGNLIAKAAAPANVLSLTWYGDGNRIASGDSEKVIRLWQLPEAPGGDLKQISELKNHTGAVTALDVFMSEPKRILSGGADGIVQSWDTDSGKNSKRVELKGATVTAVSARKDGKRFAAALANGNAKIWDAEGKEIATLKGNRAVIEGVAQAEREQQFRKDEAGYYKVAVTEAEKTQKAAAEAMKKAVDAKATSEKTNTEKQDAKKKAVEAKVAAEKTHAAPLEAIKKAQTAKDDADKAAGAAATDIKLANDKVAAAVGAIKKATDEKDASEKAVAAITKKTKDAEAKSIRAKAETARAALAKASSDKSAAEAEVVAATSKQKTANEAKTAAEKALGETQTKNKEADDKFKAADKALVDATTAAQQSEQARVAAEQNLELTTAFSKKSDQALADTKTAQAAAEAKLKEVDSTVEAVKKGLADSENWIRNVAFSPDNTLLIAGGKDGVIETFNADNGKVGEHYKANADINALAVLPGNRIVAGQADRNTSVWLAAAEFKLDKTIGTGDDASPFTGRVLALEFNAGGSKLATGGGVPSRSGELKIWDVATGNLARDFPDAHSDTVFGVDFSSDGKSIVSCGADKFIKIFDLESGKLSRVFEGHTNHVLGVSWKRDGRLIASVGADRTVKIWDLVTGEQRKTVEGFRKGVTSVHFLDSKGEFLISSGDAQIRLIREDGGDVKRISGSKDYMEAAAVSANGRIIVAGGHDSVFRVWDEKGASIVNFEQPKVEKKE